MNAYQEGKSAGYRGASRGMNPYFEWTSDGKAWLVGWKETRDFQANCEAHFRPGRRAMMD